jgi:glutamate-5-semialdehyde dehydrogenase
MNNTNIPVLGHAAGICHVYVDKAAQLDMAVNVVIDSKCQYCAVCNAMETLLVHKYIAREFLPRIKVEFEKRNVEIRGDEKTRQIIIVDAAREEDWGTEYLDYIISIKIVDSIDEAVSHIGNLRYSDRTGCHSENDNHHSLSCTSCISLLSPPEMNTVGIMRRRSTGDSG